MPENETIRDFWLKYGASKIENAFTALNSAAEKTASAIATFWGWYTLVFTIGSSIKKLDEPADVIFFLVLPIPLLIIGYVFSIWAQLPIIAEGDNRSADDIKEIYASAVKRKRSRINLAMTFTFLSACSIAIALTQANFLREKKAEGPPKKDAVDVSYQKTDSINYLLVSGDIENGSTVLISIDTLKSTAFVSTGLIYSTTVLSKDHFDITIPLPSYLKKFRTRVDWKDEPTATTSRSLFKSIELEE